MFYVSVDTILNIEARYPVWNRRVWYCFCFCFFDQFERGRVQSAAWRANEGFNDWGGRGYDDFVPGEFTKTAPSGDETT